MEWQSIKLAPKSGARFLAVVDGAVRVVAWGKTSHVPIYGFCLADQGAEDFDICEPSHWMPLPALPDEEWKPIPGFPRYEASTKGRIRRAELPDGTRIFHALKPHQNRSSGHLKVSVYRDGQQYRRGVHQLVALAFHGEPPAGKPFACHKDGDAGNCKPENIYWGSRAENTADMIRHNRRSVDSALTLTKVQARPL